MFRETEKLRRRISELEAKNRELENALKESEDRFFKIFHASSNPMSITTLKDQLIIDINNADASRGGFEREELVGRYLSDLYRNFPKEKKELIRRKIEEEGRVQNMEIDLPTKSGEIRTALVSMDPISINDEPCLLATQVDVTEMKSTQTALKQSLEYLNRVINCIGDSIFVKDREFRHVLVNDALCAWTGKRREELIGKTAQEIFPADKEHLDALMEGEKLVFETGQESVTEDEILDRHGCKRTVMTRKVLLEDDQGNRQIVGILRDITEMRHMEAQLRQAQKMEAIGVLAGGMAHDFNNLLTVILGVGEMMLAHLPENSHLHKDVGEIMKAGQAAASLTSQLLAFSRKQIISPKILDLNTVIADMSSMLQRIMGEDIELIVRAQSDLGLIKADPAQIQHLIMNLAANSRDAMPKGGKFTIETANADLDENYARTHIEAHPGRYVMLAVSDNGKGMDNEVQTHIF